MLTELRIRDFAIIQDVQLILEAGLNVLTGETGAGKSIVVGALGLLLGERASADSVRTGAKRARVEALFEVAGGRALLDELDGRGIDAADGVVILAREVLAGGRSRAWINGTPVTAATLARIARDLVNVHGQHESQTLLQPDAQRDILDVFGEATLECTRVAKAHDALAQVRREWATLAEQRRDVERRADYLQHVAAEIAAAALRPGEDTALAEEAQRLTHVAELRAHVERLRDALDGSDAALGRIALARRELTAAERIDASLGRHGEQLDAAYYALDELRRELEHYAGNLAADPERLREVEDRRDTIFRLSRKYGASIEEILQTADAARHDLTLLDSASLDLAALEERAARLTGELSEAATALSGKRQMSAERLSSAVDAILPELGMAGGSFEVAFVRLPQIGPHGAEDVEFRVTLNVGHESRPLARVASGGELSRLMLAVTTLLARLGGVPTLVFDEVDSGIGGRVALQVGAALHRLAAQRQVLVITHLPQIAARAHRHIVVEKAARGGTTTADVHAVDEERRVRELARMLGGDAERAVSRAHARELLARDDVKPSDGSPAPAASSRRLRA
ncbi:MAG: DNA repair protein RecN [Gemmatimonadaceae bacterium]